MIIIDLDKVGKQFNELGKVLSHPTRLRIIEEFLREMRTEQGLAVAENRRIKRPRLSSKQLEGRISISLGNVSHHRKVLFEKGFLLKKGNKHRRGAFETFYELDAQKETELLQHLEIIDPDFSIESLRSAGEEEATPSEVAGAA